MGQALELKEHPFFEGVDWDAVYHRRYSPPLVPPYGEVNAADAFDIGSFDDDDTQGIKTVKHLGTLSDSTCLWLLALAHLYSEKSNPKPIQLSITACSFWMRFISVWELRLYTFNHPQVGASLTFILLLQLSLMVDCSNL
ncbi:unnamed protein product [Protopolystoma xenopodis]|uniref:AGC-kinase C-terminal domain-containing protein n=1 Tax=Protopolystoma xenopodis TaxID=117903 RepID=A0A3S5B277_9PLAT|nr:unnamed protein product [Protopolystoma xenopodis]